MVLRFSLNIGHLQVIHYFYFCLATFSFTSALFFLATVPLLSLFLFLLYFFNSIVSWYMAFIIRKKLQSMMILTSTRYIMGYVVITLLMTVFAVLYWLLNKQHFDAIAVQTVSMNYFVFSVGILWVLLTNTRWVGKYFIETKVKKWHIVVKPAELMKATELQRSKAVRAVDDADSFINALRGEGRDLEKAKEELDTAKAELQLKNYINAYVFATTARKIAESAHID